MAARQQQQIENQQQMLVAKVSYRSRGGEMLEVSFNCHSTVALMCSWVGLLSRTVPWQC